MFQNYLKIAWRNVIGNKVFLFINVLVLSLGMPCCIFIFLGEKNDKAVDNFHKNSANLYTVYQTNISNA